MYVTAGGGVGINICEDIWYEAGPATDTWWEGKSIEQIVATGIDAEVAKRAAQLVDTSEYKRRQAPPGIKITPRTFGRDRRLPITNRFRGS